MRWFKKNLKYLVLVISLGFPFSTAGFKSHALDTEMLIAYPLNQECYWGDCAIDIGVLNPATGEINRLNVGLLVSPEFIQGSPSGYIFYHRDSSTYIIKVDGSEHYFIPNLDALDWSPDGQQLLGSITESEFDSKLYIMDIDGRNRIELARNLIIGGVHWSSDGQQIGLYVISADIPSEIFVVNADGTNLKQVTNLVPAGYPQWSPNGRYIAVNTDDGPYLIDLENNAARIVLDEIDSVLRWVTDSEIVQLTSSDEEGKYNLVLTNIWDRTSEVLVTGPRSAGYSVSPDGRQLVYSSPNAGNSSIGDVCVYDFETRTETCFEQANAYCCGGTVWVGKP